jgi:hypothetical protein
MSFPYVIILLLSGVLVLGSCNQDDAEHHFKSVQEQDSILLQLSPYVIRQPEELTDTAWYSNSSDSLRMQKLTHLSAKLFKYSKAENGIHYYCVYLRDNRSLYEDYRGYGGKYKVQNGMIADLEELFITPQLKIDQVKEISEALFEEIVRTGDAKKFIGKSELMQWPSETVVYNKKTNKWDVMKSNDYYFVEAMKDSIAKANTLR